MQKTGIITGAFFMLTAVILGAFGAHALKETISEESLAAFKTGVFYQFVHALSIFLVVFIAKIYKIENLKIILWFLILGIVYFSGSLYLLSTKSITGFGPSFLGPLTPIGGLFFVLAWSSLIYKIIKVKNF